VCITAYLVFLSLFDFYMVIKVWPPDPLPGVVTRSAGNPPANPPQSSTVVEQAPIKWQTSFTWCDNANPKSTCWISLNTSLFLIAMLSGALGSLLHSLRSLYWYAGNRKLVWSWAVMYMLLPFSGAVLAMIFYIVIRAGFLPSSGTSNIPNTPYGFAALGAIVGLFSEQAVLKLKQVAETVFAKPETGKDHAAPHMGPRVVSISPNSGPATGGTSVSITGTGFAPGLKVNIGGTPVIPITSVTTTLIDATTPPHAAGHADVEVVNPDGQKGVSTDGYTYT